MYEIVLIKLIHDSLVLKIFSSSNCKYSCDKDELFESRFGSIKFQVVAVLLDRNPL